MQISQKEYWRKMASRLNRRDTRVHIRPATSTLELKRTLEVGIGMRLRIWKQVLPWAIFHFSVKYVSASTTHTAICANHHARSTTRIISLTLENRRNTCRFLGRDHIGTRCRSSKVQPSFHIKLTVCFKMRCNLTEVSALLLESSRKLFWNFVLPNLFFECWSEMWRLQADVCRAYADASRLIDNSEQCYNSVMNKWLCMNSKAITRIILAFCNFRSATPSSLNAYYSRQRHHHCHPIRRVHLQSFPLVPSRRQLPPSPHRPYAPSCWSLHCKVTLNI